MKTSCGVICLRFNRNCYEALMVRKRATYAFIRFVNGSYGLSNLKLLKEYFCRMTVEEKQVILTFKFAYMFLTAYGAVKDRELLGYSKAKEKFKKLSHERVVLLIEGTPSVRPLWEFPKGRALTGEEDLSCARREFEEETRITQYQVLDLPPFVYKFEDFGVKYTFVYYYAVGHEPVKNFSVRVCPEILETRWISIHQARLITQPVMAHLVSCVVSRFKKLKPLVQKRPSPLSPKVDEDVPPGFEHCVR
jgi:8-oxo-dGTP pyrophosphatase MutT (NUDIX family)